MEEDEDKNIEERIKGLKKIVEDPQEAKKFIDQGILFQEAFGFTEDQMRNFYGFAKELCEQERFCDAADVFLVLTALNPYVCHFWLGLGLCHKIEGNYHRALFDYSMGMAVDSKNPYVFYNMADCYYHIDQIHVAKEFIDICMETCGGKDEYLELQAQALRFKEKIHVKQA